MAQASTLFFIPGFLSQTLPEYAVCFSASLIAAPLHGPATVFVFLVSQQNPRPAMTGIGASAAVVVA